MCCALGHCVLCTGALGRYPEHVPGHPGACFGGCLEVCICGWASASLCDFFGFFGLSLYACSVPSKLLGMSATLSLSALPCSFFGTDTLGCLVRLL